MSESVFMVPDFEARAVSFAESMLELLWEDVLAILDNDAGLQCQVLNSYADFVSYIKSRPYYEAVQIAFHRTTLLERTNVYDTPGRQLEEDYEDLKKRYNPYQVVTD